jgi:hypothetical protein
MRSKKGRRNVNKTNGKKIFVYALGIGAAGGAAYLAHKYLKRSTGGADMSSETLIINNDNRSILPRQTASYHDNFPLKRGSRGERVRLLQSELAKVLPGGMSKYGGIDGQFGPGTAQALKDAGFAIVVDEALFKKITGATTSALQVSFDAKSLAQNLYNSSLRRDLEGVLAILGQLKSVTDYSKTNEEYKKIGLISKTIVTDLLDISFKYNEEGKQRIRNEFLRIGLKNNTGKWTLSGFRLFNDLVTLKDTYVKDMNNNFIPVRGNTILGEEIKASDGMTFFRALDSSVGQVPSKDIKYVD